MQYLTNFLSGKFGTSMYSREFGKCLGVALQTNLKKKHIENKYRK